MSGLVCLYFNEQNKVIKSFWEKIFPIFLDYWQAWLLLSQVDASSLIATSASLRDLNYFRNPGIWEKMGDNKKFKKEREKRKGKNKKLQKEEMAWLTQNTRFDKSNINAWHKVSTLCFTVDWLHPAIFWGGSWLTCWNFGMKMLVWWYKSRIWNGLYLKCLLFIRCNPPNWNTTILISLDSITF